MENINHVTIETERLILRTPQMSDALTIQRLAGAWEIAETTGVVPHPYEDGMAEEFIQIVQNRVSEGRSIQLAMIRREDSQLVGMVGFTIDVPQETAHLGYWVGVPYWGKGYATEGARTLVDYCFTVRGLNRVESSYFTTNPASRRVMEKAGMQYEGVHRQAFIREIPAKNHRVYHDLGYCAILRADWERSQE